ncbi:hypothetical protein ACFL2B_01735 [Patescibacteria group bacterium]
MLHQAAALRHKPVIDESTKQKDKLIHILVHPDTGAILGGVGKQGVFKIAQISKQGIITAPLARADKENLNHAMQLKAYLLKAKAETESGHYLGKVVDFEFDDISWRLERIFVSSRIFFRALTSALQIARSDILSIQKNTVIVKDGLIKRGAAERTQSKSQYVSVGTGATLSKN